MRFCRSGALLVLIVLAGCARIERNTIINSYSSADCAPVRLEPGSSPPTRVWSDTVTTHKGVAVFISGAQKPGGRLSIHYLPYGRHDLGAAAGEEIYPADVRINRHTDFLYIKAISTPAALGGAQTWLFAYDLKLKKRTKDVLVDPSLLPKECPAAP